MTSLGYLQITRKDRDAEVDFEAAKKYIDELRENNFTGVLFTGGEPTLSEDLPRLLDYCRESGFIHKLVTNGQRLADAAFLDMLVQNGLDHVCMSFHSCSPEVQNYLTQNPESFDNAMAALENMSRYRNLSVDILTTINRPNSGQLCDTVRFLLHHFPFIAHFTWNNLDPRRNRTEEFPEVIPRLYDFEITLKRAMDCLKRRRKPFQVERVPLCYMEGHEHLCTETRTIVLDNKRLTSFLDERGCMLWEDYRHGKGEACGVCTVEPVCAGLHEMDISYSSDELYPLFIDRETVIRRIKRTANELYAGGAVTAQPQPAAGNEQPSSE